MAGRHRGKLKNTLLVGMQVFSSVLCAQRIRIPFSLSSYFTYCVGELQKQITRPLGQKWPDHETSLEAQLPVQISSHQQFREKSMSSLARTEEERLKTHLWENSMVKRNILVLH